MEEVKNERGTRIGESIKFFSEESFGVAKFKVRMPDIKECACTSCDLSIWSHHSSNGPQCYCPMTHEYTYQWDDGKLYTQIYDCTFSRIVFYESKRQIKEKEEKENENE